MNKEIEELNLAIRILRNFCKSKEKKGLDCCGDGDGFYKCPFVLKCPVFTDDAPCDWTEIKDEEE